MNPQYLDLSRSQLSISWKRSRFNYYSDNRKQNFHENLGVLYEKLMTIDFTSTIHTKDDFYFFRGVLDFFKDSLTALDNNTISSVPHEIIECLNIAARQWLSDFDDYIIVMTDGPFAIIPQVEDYRMFYALIKSRLGVEFKNILLTVQMPRQLSRDYLTNVCLFHELGHFVDEKLKITERVYTGPLLNKWSNNNASEVNKWFFMENDAYHVVKTSVGDQVVLLSQSKSYLGEYFADLFGAQYVGENILNYLEYLSEDTMSDGPMHPSYNKRRSMYLDFRKGINTNLVLESLFETTLALTNQGLVQKYVDIDCEDMYSFIPTIFVNDQQLLSIFKMGWEVYKRGSSPFEKKNGLSQPLPPDKLYECVNNLMEKSISNYLMVRDWNTAKQNFK